MAIDYYFVLGVRRDATQHQIEAACRVLLEDIKSAGEEPPAGRYVQEAFEVLGDPKRRQEYDASFHKIPVRPEPLSGKPAAEPLIPSKAPQDVIDVSLMRSFRTASPSFEEIHERFRRNFTDVARPKSEELESLAIEVPITPQQALTGGAARVLVPAQGDCPLCGGQGSLGSFVCRRCDGGGTVSGEYPVMVSYPAGISNYTVQVPLDRFGIHNFYLTVHFRVTGEAIE